MRVAACLVTRGNVPMDDIIESIPHEWEVVVWDNSKREDLGVYGRYAAIALTDADVIYVQDDDCVLEAESMHALVTRAKMLPFCLFANMPERFRPHYPDSCLVGFGAAFGRDLPKESFDKLEITPPLFNLTCDVYFTALVETQRFLMDLPYRDQPWASDSDRMWKQPTHVGTRANALREARALR
jgi:hypothetical protein